MTRYFARYGSADVLNDNEFPVTGAGASYLRRVASNLGSITALVNMTSGMKVGFGRIPPEVLLTFPSAYQLLAHPLNEWQYTTLGKPLQRDLFDIEIWRALQYSIFRPEVAERI